MLEHRRHIPALDGLRGVAIAAVLLFHLYPGSERDPLAHVARLGWLGVDLFFVLSGFLITGILVDTQDDPRCLRNFYVRRCLRLLPLYTVVSVAVVAWSAAAGWGPTRWTAPYFLYGSNIVLNLAQPIGVDPRLNVTHFWSLAVEEQFYMLWPWLVLWARRPRRVLWVCVAGALLSLALRWAASFAAPGFLHGQADMERPLHLDGLMLGGALAVAMRDPELRPRCKFFRCVAIACGTALLMTAFFHPHLGVYSRTSARYVLALAAVLFAALVGLAVEPGTWVERTASWSPLRWLGRYSYGIYVLHFPLVKQLERHTMPPESPHTIAARAAELAWMAGYLVLTLAAAVASYHLLELPCLRLKRRFAYRDEQRAHAVQVDPVIVESTDSNGV